MDILGDTRIDWIRFRWWFAGISLAVLVAGLFDVIRKDGLRYGIDFSEGTMVVAKFAETPEIDNVRAVVTDLGYGSAVIQSYDRPEMNQVMIRVEKAAEDETAGAPGQQPTQAGIDETANRILAALRGGAAGELVSSSTEIVGPVVGEELRRRARNAT